MIHTKVTSKLWDGTASMVHQQFKSQAYLLIKQAPNYITTNSLKCPN